MTNVIYLFSVRFYLLVWYLVSLADAILNYYCISTFVQNTKVRNNISRHQNTYFSFPSLIVFLANSRGYYYCKIIFTAWIKTVSILLKNFGSSAGECVTRVLGTCFGKIVSIVKSGIHRARWSLNRAINWKLSRGARVWYFQRVVSGGITISPWN